MGEHMRAGVENVPAAMYQVGFTQFRPTRSLPAHCLVIPSSRHHSATVHHSQLTSVFNLQPRPRFVSVP